MRENYSCTIYRFLCSKELYQHLRLGNPGPHKCMYILHLEGPILHVQWMFYRMELKQNENTENVRKCYEMYI